MKIEITNEGEYYHIYTDGSTRPIKNLRENFLNQFAFQDEDIFNLIGENTYNKAFQKGKYEFTVTKKQLQLIIGERSAQTRLELEMYPD